MQCQKPNRVRLLGIALSPSSILPPASCKASLWKHRPALLPDIAEVFHQLRVASQHLIKSQAETTFFSFHFSFSTKWDVLFSVSPLISRTDVGNNLGCNFSSGFSNFKVCHLNRETGVCSLAHSLSWLMHWSLCSWKHTVNMVSVCLEKTLMLTVNVPPLWSEAITPENWVTCCPGSVCSAVWH